MKTDSIPPLAALPMMAATPRDQAAFEQEQRRRAASRVPMLLLKDCGLLVPGDIAGFDPWEVDQIEAAGTATRNLDFKPASPEAKTAQAAAEGIVSVSFKMPWQSYMPGDVAGFPAALARQLRSQGIAEPTSSKTPPRRTLASIRAAILGR